MLVPVFMLLVRVWWIFYCNDEKNKLKIPQNRPIADFLPTITITAKNLAIEITNFSVKKDALHGEKNITTEQNQCRACLFELIFLELLPKIKYSSATIETTAAKTNA